MAGIAFFNSKECEWSDIKVFIEGVELTKLRGLSYKAAKEKNPLHASGDRPLSIQGGNRTYEGVIKVLKGALDDMNLAARVAGGDDVLDLEFNIVITYRAKGIRGLKTDTLVGVQVKEFEKAMEQGAGFMEVSLPIAFLDLIPG